MFLFGAQSPLASSTNSFSFATRHFLSLSFQGRVRAHIGFEYECAAGHRFIAASADRLVQRSGSGYVKGNANKALRLDMPLLFPCCGVQGTMVCGGGVVIWGGGGSSLMPLPLLSSQAQLVRIHIVIPDLVQPLRLNPKIQVSIDSSRPTPPPPPLQPPPHPPLHPLSPKLRASPELVMHMDVPDGQLLLESNGAYILCLPRVFAHKVCPLA